MKNFFNKFFTGLKNTITKPNVVENPQPLIASNFGSAGETSSGSLRSAANYVGLAVAGSVTVAGMKSEVEVYAQYKETLKNIETIRKMANRRWAKHGECQKDTIDHLANFQNECVEAYRNFKHNKSPLTPVAGVQRITPNSTLNKKIEILEKQNSLSHGLIKINNKQASVAEKEQAYLNLLRERPKIDQVFSVYEAYFDSFLVNLYKFIF